jgi:hypothetical protein
MEGPAFSPQVEHLAPSRRGQRKIISREFSTSKVAYQQPSAKRAFDGHSFSLLHIHGCTGDAVKNDAVKNDGLPAAEVQNLDREGLVVRHPHSQPSKIARAKPARYSAGEPPAARNAALISSMLSCHPGPSRLR